MPFYALAAIENDERRALVSHQRRWPIFDQSSVIKKSPIIARHATVGETDMELGMTLSQAHILSSQSRGHRSGSAIRWVLLGVAIGAIFIADTLTNYEIAVAVFYVAPVLISAEFLGKVGVLGISCLCACLALGSFMLPREGIYQAGTINCVLSICAIAATAYLALQRSSALLAEHEAKAQLTRLSRVNTLGEMATSIAHEVNQPLTGIVSSAGACRNWLAIDPPNIAKAQQALERMIGDANRASGIVDRVRNLSKRGAPKVEWINADTLVTEVIALCRRELDRSAVSVIREPDVGPTQVFADAVQIQQVLINLILNALEAMSGSGGRGRNVFIAVALQPGNMVLFTVGDTGHGVAPHLIEHMFDPFYSTKDAGIGMGLAISRSIVESHTGRIWAEPDPQGGAKFYFSLPGRMGASG